MKARYIVREGVAAVETKRVLIVDDDPESVRMAVSLLRDEPYRLLWSDEPAAALALAHTHLPDLILLSWTLPDMTGDEFAEQLASHPETADIPIVLVSLEPWLFAPSRRERATQVINRTFMDAELAPRVREALGLEPSPWLSPTDLVRIRDRSQWWAGEEEGDWRMDQRLKLASIGW